jgi:hypothetical protein
MLLNADADGRAASNAAASDNAVVIAVRSVRLLSLLFTQIDD